MKRSNAEGKKSGAALWFQKSVTSLPEPARNQAYPKRNRTVVSTNHLGFHF